MKAKLLNPQGEKMYAIIFDKGEEFMAGMQEFAQQHPGAASFTAIGAFSSATLGYFDHERMDYKQIAVDEQTEALALVGDIARHKSQPKVHAHVVRPFRWHDPRRPYPGGARLADAGGCAD